MGLALLKSSGEAAAWRDIAVAIPPGVRLESGETLSAPEVTLRVFGDQSRPAVVALGGISADRKVATIGDANGWWDAIAGPSRAIDTDAYCVIGLDFLPGGDEQARTITSADQARILGIALDAIDIARLHAFVGASYGGMVGLAFAARYPERLNSLCVISASDRPHPAATALRGIQRRILAFASDCGRPEDGVSLARQLAMTTYRSPEEFAERFNSAPGPAAGDPYDICNYLISRGEAYDMSPARFVTLSDSIDRHRVDANLVRTKTLLISNVQDRLTPPADMRRLQVALGGPAALVEIDSIYGHDAFLKEQDAIGRPIKSFLEENDQ